MRMLDMDEADFQAEPLNIGRILETRQPAFEFSCISAHPCKRCTPALKGFVIAAVLRSLGHGNCLQPQSVALVAGQQPAFRSSQHALHTSPEGLR